MPIGCFAARLGMRGIIEMTPNQPGGMGRRLAWFVGLWAAGVAMVGLVSLILRVWIA